MMTTGGFSSVKSDTRLVAHDYHVVVRGFGVKHTAGSKMHLKGVKHKQDLKEHIRAKLMKDQPMEPIKDIALWMPGYEEWVGLSRELDELRAAPLAPVPDCGHLLQLYGADPGGDMAPPDGGPPPLELEPEPDPPPPPFGDAPPKFQTPASAPPPSIRSAAAAAGMMQGGFAPQTPTMMMSSPSYDGGGGYGSAFNGRPESPDSPDSAYDSNGSPRAPQMLSDQPLVKALRQAIRTIPTMPDQIKKDKAMSEALAEQLLPRMRPMQFQQYQTIIDQGADADTNMYFLVSGNCEVIIDTKMVALLQPPQIFGEKCIGDPHSVRTATIRAQGGAQAGGVQAGSLSSADFQQCLAAMGFNFVQPGQNGGRARLISQAGQGGNMRAGPPGPLPAAPAGLPWTVKTDRLQMQIVFFEPAAGQEAKLDKTCFGYCSFTAVAGSCENEHGEPQEGYGFSVDMVFSGAHKQKWSGVVQQSDGSVGKVLLANSGCVAVGTVDASVSRELKFDLELKYMVTPQARLQQLSKGNADHLARLTAQSNERAGRYMCRIQITGKGTG